MTDSMRAGAEILVHTTIDAMAAEIDDPDLAEAAPIADHAGAPCVARLGPKSRLDIGAVVDLPFDTSDLQLFDARSGLTLRRAG